MFRERARSFQGVWMTLDVICITVAFGLALLLRIAHESIPVLRHIPSIPLAAEMPVRSDYALLLGVSLVAWILSLKRSGLYLPVASRSVGQILLAQLRALTLAGLVTAAVVFVLKMHVISRLFFAYYFSLSFLLLCAKDIVLGRIVRSLYRSVLARRHALVIGGGRSAAWFARVLQEASDQGYELVGLLLTRKIVSVETFGVPVLGTIDDVDRTLTEHPVDEVFVVAGAGEMATLAPVAETLIKRGRVVSLVTPLASSADGVRGRVTDFSGIPMISYGPMPRDEVGLTLKRLVDVVISAVTLTALSPLLGLLALIIKVLDPGPVLFAQERLGRGGDHFRLYKFRSMRVDAESILRADRELYERYKTNDYKLPEGEDPRISRLGRLLRRSSLDELPQLWNVLKGDMTLVGPRPIVPAEIEKYEPYTELLLSTQPGVTGRWQVNGRSDVRYPERAFVDLDYVGKSSLGEDFSILARTLPAVLLRRGAR